MVKGNEEDIPYFYRADSRARRQALANRQIIRDCRERVERIYQSRVSGKAQDAIGMNLPEFVACLLPTVETAYCASKEAPICWACSGTKHHCPLSVVKQLYSIGSEFESARNLMWEAGIDSSTGASNEEPVIRSDSGKAYLSDRYDWEDPEGDYDPDSGIMHFGPLRHWAGIPDYDIDTLSLAKDLLKEAWYFISVYRHLVPQPEYRPEEYLTPTPEMSEVNARIIVLSFTVIVERDSNWVIH